MNTRVPHVLIVDDEPAVRESLVEFMQGVGFHVDGASDGPEALDLLSKKDYDVAFIDVALPSITGESLILSAREAGSNSAFLIYTGSHDYQLSAPLRKIGLTQDHIVYKPIIDMSALIDRIRSMTK